MSEPWCDFSDLAVSQCAHCTSGDVIPPRLGSAQQGAVDTAKEIYGSKAVPAVFNGVCPACGKRIRKEDDYIIRVGSGWVHEECVA